MTQEQVIEKLRKLLALAERGGTEAEGAVAMAKAQELLAAHKLSMSDLEVRSEKMGEGEMVKAARGWKVKVVNSAAKLCFCQSFRRGTSMIIVGKSVDIILARNLADYLLATGERLVSRDPITDWYYRHAWRIGYAQRISERVDALVAAAKRGPIRDSETGKELILSPLYAQSDKEVSTFVKQNYKLRTTQRTSTVRRGDGYAAGEQAGNSVNLGSRNLSGKSVLGIGNK